MIKKFKNSLRYKIALFIFMATAAGFVVAIPVMDGNSIGTVIKSAIAESECPAPIPSTYATLRSGSANGPILGNYSNSGWNSESGQPNPTFAQLEVPAGTVIYYSNHTEGVELTNRSQGSTHGYSSAVTITSPPNKAGFYSNGYYFTKQQFVTGYTNPINSDVFMSVGGHNSCWGGFDDGESFISIQIRVQNAPPSPTIRTGTTSLAVVKDPTVSLLVNGQQSVSVPNGATPTLTWSTNSVNIGDSCVASNNNPDTNTPDPSWNGAKLGQASYTPPNPPPPGGGSQQIGPLTNSGVFTYSIRCYGLNNVVSQLSSVQITVGNAPSYSCSITPPGIQSVPRGSNRSVTLQVIPQNGYNSPVDFAVTSISPSTPVPPVVTINGNPQTSPYSSAAVATIATSVNPATTTGEYTIQVTGTGGVNCPPIRINVTSNPGTIDIKFNGSDGPVDLIPPADSGTLTWAPTGDVASCTASMTEGEYPAWQGARPATGNQGVTALQANTRYTFKIDCVTALGEQTQPDTVTVRVGNPPAVDPFVDLKCRATAGGEENFVDGVCIINSGERAELQARSTDATSCTLVPAIDGYTPTPNTTTTTLTPNLTSNQIYTLSCNGEPGTTPKADQVEIRVNAVNNPIVDLKCKGTNPVNPIFVDGACTINSGDQAQLQASSSNATSCTLTPAIVGYTPTPNSTTTTNTPNLTSNQIYILSCNGGPGTTPQEDQVEIRVAQITQNPNFGFFCSGSPLPIVAGSFGGAISITTTVENWPAGTLINISHSSTPLTVSYDSNNPNVPPSTTIVTISAGAAIGAGSYMIVFTGTPTPAINGVNPKICPVTVLVSAGTVQPPTNVNASTTCGQATVTWNPPFSGPAPGSYEIFRTATIGGGGVPAYPVGPIATVSGSTFSFRDNNPILDITSYYGIRSELNGARSSIISSNGVYVIPCRPSLDQSDKDVYQIDSVVDSPAPARCQDNDAFSLPNQSIIRANARVYFNINVCNSGNQDLSNLRVIETDLHNLSDLRLENQGGCVLGGAGTQSNPFRVNDLPAPAVVGEYTVCTIKLSAKVTAPSNAVGLLHRFWNIAYIYANELPGGKKVATPPYTFSIGGTPTRNETSP